jgi:5-methyltetrahydrofolate--homocysteine methyltransferase
LKIAPAYPNLVVYARDAMDGLELAGRIVNPAKRHDLEAQLSGERARLEARRPSEGATPIAGHTRSGAVPVLETVPCPPDYDRHLLRNIRLDEVWQYLNPVMLYGKHMGLKRKST